MSCKIEKGSAKYPTTSDLRYSYFFGQFCFCLTRYESAIDHLLSGESSFGLVKASNLQDLLSSEFFSLLGKTDYPWTSLYLLIFNNMYNKEKDYFKTKYKPSKHKTFV